MSVVENVGASVVGATVTTVVDDVATSTVEAGSANAGSEGDDDQTKV